jgi:hypothetical protein
MFSDVFYKCSFSFFFLLPSCCLKLQHFPHKHFCDALGFSRSAEKLKDDVSSSELRLIGSSCRTECERRMINNKASRKVALKGAITRGGRGIAGIRSCWHRDVCLEFGKKDKGIGLLVNRERIRKSSSSVIERSME